MLTVWNCVAYEHDYRLLALAVVVCVVARSWSSRAAIPTRRSAGSNARAGGRLLLFLPRLVVRIDDVASLVLGRPQDDLVAGVAELIDVVTGDALVLGLELARLRPLAVLAE